MRASASEGHRGRLGVLGATSLVGHHLLPLAGRAGQATLAVSRSAAARAPVPGVSWCRPGGPESGSPPVATWISLCPIWVVPDLLPWLEHLGIERLVATSSMSRETKRGSAVAAERRLADRLAAAEDRLRAWATDRRRRLVILRPTMIYDGIRDGNVTAIAAWVRRLGWFPLCGRADGLRQPVHAGDVAAACLAAATHPAPAAAYPLSGGEAVTFRTLVERTCRASGLAPRMMSLPPWAWNAAAGVVGSLGLAPTLTRGMGHRMNEDLSCDHRLAAADLGFRPRPFVPGGGTLGVAAGREGFAADSGAD